jgi:AcrR family transcriptional regulator
MPRRTQHGPSAWIAAALRLLAERGEAAVGIEPLARRLGASKGGFYHHFADRPALMAALLAAWETRAAGLIGRVEASGSTPSARLWALIETVAHEGAGSPEPAIRLWARSDGAARAALGRVDRARLAWLETLFRSLGLGSGPAATRAHLAYMALIGEHALGDNPSPDERLVRARRLHAFLTAR